MKVKIDLRKCHKSGECYYNHPELFRVGDEGFPVVQVDDISDKAMQGHAQQAIEVCPAVAITLED